jgi:hypothetical protein
MRRAPEPSDADAAAHDGPDRGASLFILIEPRNEIAPSLFRSRNFDLNGIAPRHGNDPIAIPMFAEALGRVRNCVMACDDRPGESLARFWDRCAALVRSSIAALPSGLELVRVFGQ